VAMGGALLHLGSGGDPESSSAYVAGWRLALASGGGLALLAALLAAVMPASRG
jgi:hypothetical protein